MKASCTASSASLRDPSVRAASVKRRCWCRSTSRSKARRSPRCARRTSGASGSDPGIHEDSPLARLPPGGTGSNVYTRALARAWSRAGHEVVVFSPGPPSGAVRPRRRDGRPARPRRRSAAGVRPRPLRGHRGALPPGPDRRRALRLRAAERRGRARAPARGPPVRQPRAARARPVGAAVGMPFGVKAHGSELEFSIRGERGAARVGARDASTRRTRSTRARSTSATCSRRWSARAGTPTGSTSSRRGSTSTSCGRSRATRRSPRLLAGGRAVTPPTRATRRSACPTTGNAERLAAFLSGDGPDRRLRRASSRRRRASTSCSRRSAGSRTRGP